MQNQEISNIRDKNSQEILLYLQKKDLEKNKKYLDCDYRKKFSNKKFTEDNYTDNLPKSRMNQIINKSFFSYEGKKSPSKCLSNETKEQTPITSTPKFIKDKSPISIIFNKNRNNSQFSFSNENNANEDNPSEDSLNYLDFNLHENIDISSKKTSFNEDNLNHKYLPRKYKDNEEYKSWLYKYLKCETEKNYSYQINGIKTKNISPKKELSQIPRRKKVYSVKKKNINKIIFFDNNEEKEFNLYKDANIGIDKKWQLNSLYKNFDNDVETDDEQIDNAKNKMLHDLKIGIVRWSQNKNNCYNYKLMDSRAEIDCIKRFSISV